MTLAVYLRTHQTYERVKYCHFARINILGADPRMNPFNNDFFNGKCDTVKNPSTEQHDRIPWNIGILQYQVNTMLFLHLRSGLVDCVFVV